MKKKTASLLIIFVLIDIFILGIVAVILIRRNTGFLTFNISDKDLSKNNTNNDLEATPEENDPYIELQEQILIVPDELKKGTFSETRKLNLPEGVKISLYASGMKAPRSMTFDEAGNMFVTDKSDGKVLLIKDDNSDDIGDPKIVIDSSLRNPHGIDYFEGDLYVGEEHQIIVYRGIKFDGKFTNKEVLVKNLPTGGHVTRTVVIGPDRKMYVAVGSSCNVCEEEDNRRAAISRYDLDGSKMELFAVGLRNTVGFVFSPDGKIWGVDNGRDLLGNDIPPEEVNIIEEGKNYGWPYCYGSGVNNPEFSDKKTFCASETAYPTYEMQAHSAPLGIDYIYEDNNPLDDILNDQLLISFHGSWNRTVPTGYKVVRIDTNDKEAESIDFVTGWLQKNGSAWGRPVDIESGEDDAFYITDDHAGAIYRLSAGD